MSYSLIRETLINLLVLAISWLLVVVVIQVFLCGDMTLMERVQAVPMNYGAHWRTC